MATAHLTPRQSSGNTPAAVLSRCYLCGAEKPRAEFVRDRHKASGFASRCRECDRARSAARYAADPEPFKRRSTESQKRIREAGVDVVSLVARRAGGVRVCSRCPNPAASSRHWYCAECGARAEAARVARRYRGGLSAEKLERERLRERLRVRERGSSAERGYGAAHQRVRAGWAPWVAAGLVCCARCGDPIVPGSPWDLGHDDADRSRYSGPEHRACNRATAGRARGKRG